MFKGLCAGIRVEDCEGVSSNLESGPDMNSLQEQTLSVTGEVKETPVILLHSEA